MVHTRSLRQATTKDLGLPRIQMAVKMNNTDRAIQLLDAPQNRQDDGVVPTQRDNPWQRLTVQAGARFVRVRGRSAGQ
jgi:hypothetical protein